MKRNETLVIRDQSDAIYPIWALNGWSPSAPFPLSLHGVSQGYNDPPLQQKLCSTLHHQGEGQPTANASGVMH